MSTTPSISTARSDSVIRARIAQMAAQKSAQSQVIAVASSAVSDMTDFDVRQVEIVTEIAYRNSKPKNRTVCRVISKAKVEKAMTIGGLILAVQGVAKTAFALVCFVFSKIPRMLPKALVDTKIFYPFPFWGVDSLMSIYSIYDSVIHGLKAHKKKDRGGINDHSINIASNTANMAGIGALAATSIYTFKGAIATAATAGAVASGFGSLFFTFFTMGHALNLKRVYKTLSSIRAVFLSSENPTEKCKKALLSIKNQLFLTKEDRDKITTLANGDKKKAELLIEITLKRKFDILARRIGQKLATKLQASFGKRALFFRLESQDLELKRKAFEEGAELLQEYRFTLNKQLMIRILKASAGVFGIIACALSVATPPGAAVAAVAFFAAFFLCQTYAWYVDNKQKPEKLSILMDFAIPTVQELMKPYLQPVAVEIAKQVGEKLKLAQEKRKEVLDIIMGSINFRSTVVIPNPFAIESSISRNCIAAAS